MDNGEKGWAGNVETICGQVRGQSGRQSGRGQFPGTVHACICLVCILKSKSDCFQPNPIQNKVFLSPWRSTLSSLFRRILGNALSAYGRKDVIVYHEHILITSKAGDPDLDLDPRATM